MKNRIVIADDDANLRDVLKLRCESLGLHVTLCSNGIDALTTISRDPPALIILDINMPAGDGVSVCKVLASNPNIPPVPVIMLSGRDDEDTIHECEDMGAHYFLKGADVWECLEPRICEILEIPCPSHENSPESSAENECAPKDSERTVLVIDDDLAIGQALTIKLAQYGIRVVHAQSGMQGYWVALKEQPRAIILDFNMPDGRGDYVLGRLKNHTLTRDIPVIVLTGQTRGGKTDFGLKRELDGLGAARFHLKPLNFDKLLVELREYLPLPATPIAEQRQVGAPVAAY